MGGVEGEGKKKGGFLVLADEPDGFFGKGKGKIAGVLYDVLAFANDGRARAGDPGRQF